VFSVFPAPDSPLQTHTTAHPRSDF